MNKTAFSICLAIFAIAPAFAQSVTPAAASAATTAAPAPPTPALTYFDLDFSGGTPGQLVAAVQAAMHRPVNVIVPNEYADWKLPPLKMSHVTMPQLFHSFEASPGFISTIDIGNGNYQTVNTRSTRRRSCSSW